MCFLFVLISQYKRPIRHVVTKCPHSGTVCSCALRLDSCVTTVNNILPMHSFLQCQCLVPLISSLCVCVCVCVWGGGGGGGGFIKQRSPSHFPSDMAVIGLRYRRISWFASGIENNSSVCHWQITMIFLDILCDNCSISRESHRVPQEVTGVLFLSFAFRYNQRTCELSGQSSGIHPLLPDTWRGF